MSELVVMSGAGNIARSVVAGILARSGGKYASVKLVDARPFRRSVYAWQSGLAGVRVNKVLARSAQSLDLALDGAKDVVYFTHDYSTLASDKNNHLKAVAGLTKKHGIKNFVAVCPFENNLAWSEDDTSFHTKAMEAQNSAIKTNSDMTLLQTNLVFGKESHMIHFLTQCAIVGKAPYKSFVNHSTFKYAPIHSDDVASAVCLALEGGNAGHYTLSGADEHSLKGIMNTLEASAGKGVGSTGGPIISGAFDLWWDFWTGNTSDMNMSRMIEFYNKNSHMQSELNESSWHDSTGTNPSVHFAQHYESQRLTEADFAHPTMASYKLAHTD